MTYLFKTHASDSITLEEYQELAGFVHSQEGDPSPAYENMLDLAPAGFLYNIRTQQRWRSDQGKIYAATDQQNNILAVSCVEYPENSVEWALGGIRTWIVKSHRGTHLPSAMLSEQVQWCAERGCRFMLLTFNEYNRRAHTALRLTPTQRRASGWSTWWDDCVAVPTPLVIRNTEQWCVIKPVCESNNQENLKKIYDWANSLVK